MMGRIVVMVDRLGPYHAARLAAAARESSIAVVEVFARTETYAWDPVECTGDFERVTVFPARDERAVGVRELEGALSARLEALRPEVVALNGWSEPAALLALAWCGSHGTRALMMCESTEADEMRSWWREWVKRRVLRLCSAGFVGGRLHAYYLARLGMDADRIFAGYDAVDNGYFAERVALVRAEAEALRKRYGLPKDYFVAVGRFVAKKNLAGLLRGYARYVDLVLRQPAGNEPWHLVLVGDGPLRESVNAEVGSLGIGSCVHLSGFKQYEDLPVYYGLARTFVHASRTEPWGLVVNEAMATGLPVVVSNRCGCVPELLREGCNGFGFDPEDVEGLGRLLFRVSRLAAEKRGAMGSESARIVAGFGTSRFAAGLKKAAEAALRGTAPRVGVRDRVMLRLVARVRTGLAMKSEA